MKYRHKIQQIDDNLKAMRNTHFTDEELNWIEQICR